MTPALKHLVGRGRLAVLLPLGAAGMVASGGCGGRAEPCVPCVEAELDQAGSGAIASVEAEVEEIQVGPVSGATPANHEFQLFAWYRDAAGKVISGRFDPFIWKLQPSTEGSADPFGLVTLSSGPTADVSVLVHDDGSTFSDNVTLKRWNDVTAAGAASDVIEAAHQAKRPPNAVLLEERGAANTCAWGKARPFVGLAAVGKQNGIPCSLSLFSTDHAAVYEEAITSWASPIKPTLGAPLDLDVTIFIAVTGRTASLLSGFALTSTDQLAQDVAKGAEALASMDVTWANLAYEANRVGIRIQPTYVTIDPTTPDLAKLVGAHPFSCSKPRGLPKPPSLPYQYDGDAISVYYVDWIDYPPDPIHAGARGVHCHFWYQGQPGEPGPVIFISYTKHSAITLAHEIGHALGLDDEEEALGALNLMHNLLPDGPLGADARSRLTVGQVFRMNVWNDSWITTRPSVTRPTRLCRSTSEPCPPVGLDAR